MGMREAVFHYLQKFSIARLFRQQTKRIQSTSFLHPISSIIANLFPILYRSFKNCNEFSCLLKCFFPIQPFKLIPKSFLVTAFKGCLKGLLTHQRRENLE